MNSGVRWKGDDRMNSEQAAVVEQLFHAYFNVLQIRAYRYLRNWDLSAQAAQETFYVACRRVDRLMASPNRVGWLMKTVTMICKNKVRDQLRQEKLLVAWDELEERSLPGVLDQYDIGVAEKCRSLLSQEEYDLLCKVVVQGVPYDEAAWELGIQMWACRKRVQRILARLRNQLSEYREPD